MLPDFTNDVLASRLLALGDFGCGLCRCLDCRWTGLATTNKLDSMEREFLLNSVQITGSKGKTSAKTTDANTSR